ncbi:hypothetical protein E5D57_001086 [Metarhizium anisopliae]|nr:hypothetical protein E5D57_001086 [Metarhizium anisopliae]
MQVAGMVGWRMQGRRRGHDKTGRDETRRDETRGGQVEASADNKTMKEVQNRSRASHEECGTRGGGGLYKL